MAILLTRVDDDTKSPWHRLKEEPKQPTAQNNREFLDHLSWLREQAIGPSTFRDIPEVKLKQFAAEARSLDVASMNDLTEPKRLTLAAALVFAQTGQALDDVADMYVRLVQRLHNQARTENNACGTKSADWRILQTTTWLSAKCLFFNCLTLLGGYL